MICSPFRRVERSVDLIRRLTCKLSLCFTLVTRLLVKRTGQSKTAREFFYDKLRLNIVGHHLLR